MNILLLGAEGQLGRTLRGALAPLGPVTALGRAGVDLADAGALRAVIRARRPAVIVNAAAYTAVDRAESEPVLAEAVNAVAPGVIGEEAARLGAAVVHYSTDYVFDGRKHGPYHEADPPGPLSVYGRTKWAGELALAAATPRHLVLRTSWVVGPHGRNFVKTMLRLAAERETLQVVADQHGAPTSTALLAAVTAQLLAQQQAAADDAFPYGLYHVAPAGETTWHGLARWVIADARRRSWPLRAGPEQVQAITTADYPTPAHRPANSVLDTRRLARTFNLTLPAWQTGMAEIMERF